MTVVTVHRMSKNNTNLTVQKWKKVKKAVNGVKCANKITIRISALPLLVRLTL